MTGTSINDLKSFFTQPDGMPGVKQPQQSKDGDNSFSRAMAEMQNRPAGANENGVNAQDGVKQAQSKPVVKQTGRRDLNEKTVKDADNGNDQGIKKQGFEDKDIDAKLSAKTDGIKKAIQDELGITEEELEQAMETLQMTMGDLLNPDSVKELMMEITGTESPVDLLTNEDLLSGIQTVTQLVDDSIDALKEELGLDDEQFAGLLERIDKAVSEMKEMPEAKESGDEFMEELPKQEVPVEGKEAVSQPLAKPANTEPQKNETDMAAPKEDSTLTQNVNTQNGNLKLSKNNGTEFNGEQKNDQADQTLQQMPQTIIQTEVNELGEVVRTVREYSSYAENAEIVNQVTEQIRVNIGSDSTSMEMMLHPASLGAVNIQVTQQGDALHAQIFVQNEQVKEALQAQIEQLMKTFEEQGQKVTQVEVSVANYNLEQGFAQDQNNQGNPRGESDGSRRLRRSLDLNALSDDMLEELDEDQRLQAEVMSMNGASVEYHA
ncbi:MAG: flagellar hook-length control protein FliK [Lachnospiraceae bacterium]|nr:flagellar hook-length control protein FliK [Lachnospiraceae bacterium]